MGTDLKLNETPRQTTELQRPSLFDSLEREEHLRLADDAEIGSWVMEVSTGQIRATAKARELFQIRPDEEATFQSFLRAVHSEDRDQLDQALRGENGLGDPLSVEHRTLLHGGGLRWISTRCRRHQYGADQRERLIGVSTDITERKTAQAQIQQAAVEWRATFDSIQHPVMILDANSKVLRANAASRTLLASAGGILGQYCSTLVRGSCAKVSCPLKAALVSRQHEEAEIYDEKERRWLRESVDPLFNEKQEVSRLVFSLEDITERKLSEERHRKSIAEVQNLRERLRVESECLMAETDAPEPQGIITAHSEAIKQALRQLQHVAPTDSTVLLYGETGVGKELFADAIHRLSPRRGKPIITVNCAALPSPLVESELFGREKGAYTGALTQQRGRFEVADGSSIFLDEIAELSLEVQAKLLRVLQEGQFERLGSPRTVQVNVRLIAATNRNLQEEVRKGRFRQDLFYRLNVFPITIPPLRQRMEDIPLLVWTFVEEFSERMGKKITRVPRKTMEALQHYSWPGNVRELRNVIERSVIITSGETLRVTLLHELQQTTQPLTLAETQREHILRILESTMWHIKGPNGAARKLDLKPSTLYTRMQKLGIPNRSQRDGIRT